MRVLVACEFSGAVRDAFISRGHDAYLNRDYLDLSLRTRLSQPSLTAEGGVA